MVGISVVEACRNSVNQQWQFVSVTEDVKFNKNRRKKQ